MKKLLLAAILFMSGCTLRFGGELESDPSCDPNNFHGEFRLTSTTISGNCGDIPGQVINFDNLITGTMCVETKKAITNNGCKLVREVSCSNEWTKVMSMTQVFSQLSADEMTGSITADSIYCKGEYRLHLTRI